MLIVSGASANHGKSLIRFAKSARLWEPWSTLLLYDLGLNDNHRGALEGLGLKTKRFPFESYPDHFDIRVNAGEYAWKPAIIWNELQSYHGRVCWMDAGNLIRWPLILIRQELGRIGFYSAKSESPVERWTYPGMFDALDLPRTFAAGRDNLNGACIAFDWAHKGARALAKEWADAAMHKEIIAPPGSSRKNHRQDQALLTVLAYRSELIDRPSPTSRAFLTHQDVPEV